jgi:hypothetical protein
MSLPAAGSSPPGRRRGRSVLVVGVVLLWIASWGAVGFLARFDASRYVAARLVRTAEKQGVTLALTDLELHPPARLSFSVDSARIARPSWWLGLEPVGAGQLRVAPWSWLRSSGTLAEVGVGESLETTLSREPGRPYLLRTKFTTFPLESLQGSFRRFVRIEGSGSGVVAVHLETLAVPEGRCSADLVLEQAAVGIPALSGSLPPLHPERLDFEGRLADGVLEVERLEMDLAEGRLSATGAISLDKRTGSLDLELRPTPAFLLKQPALSALAQAHTGQRGSIALRLELAAGRWRLKKPD